MSSESDRALDSDSAPTSSDDAAYAAFTEGAALLASSNPHAAVVALERARALEPEKASIRETLGRAYFCCRRFRRRDVSSRAPWSSSRRTTTPISGSG